MKLETLKKGDKLEVQYGLQKCNAKVIENFPKENKIKLEVNIKIFFISYWLEDIFNYYDYHFDKYKYKLINTS